MIQCDCESVRCENASDGHVAGACKGPPVVKVKVFGCAEFVCTYCMNSLKASKVKYEVIERATDRGVNYFQEV